MEYKYGMNLAGCYIVWNPTSKLPPQKLFGSRKKALDAAKIMSKKNPGELFVVCKLEASAVVGEPVVKDFAESAIAPSSGGVAPGSGIRFDPFCYPSAPFGFGTK